MEKFELKKRYQHILLIKSTILIVFTILCSCRNTSPYSSDPETISLGEQSFTLHCSACHNFISNGIGPNLSGITKEMSFEWIKSFISNPNDLIKANDERASAIFEQYKTLMPAFQFLEDEEIDQILSFMNTFQVKDQVLSRRENVLKDPIPVDIPLSPLTLIMEEYLTMPFSDEGKNLARINTIKSLGNDRLFVSDLNGYLYEITDGNVLLRMDFQKEFEHFINKPGLATGFGSYAFHPDFGENHLMYTTHTEDPKTSDPAHFSYDDSLSRVVRWVLTEWKLNDPDSEYFKGQKRELFRIDMITGIHGMQDIDFNPVAEKGDPDYGKLYICIGDGGSVEHKVYHLTQHPETPWGSILRIDPLGKNSANKQYGIPEDNPNFSSSKNCKEKWAYGFRNPHRLMWDEQTGNMYVSGIGQKQIEELNLVKMGGNYGWPLREGTFELDYQVELDSVYEISDRKAGTFMDPVLQLDHDDVSAISGGFIYRGALLHPIQGKYIFGDILDGDIFMTTLDQDVEKNIRHTQKLQMKFAKADSTITMRKILGKSRVDFRLGLDLDNEILLMSKANAKIYRVVGME